MKKIRLVLFAFLGLIVFSAYASAQFSGRDDYIALHRLFNSQINDHLYTTDCREKDNLIRNGSYVYEGVTGYVATRQARQTTPLYRLLLSSGEHFYTIDRNEMNQLNRDSRNRLEGTVGYLAENEIRNTAPFYRLIVGNRHLYTANEREKNSLLRNSANRLEGTEGYIWTSGRNNCDSNSGGSGGGSYDYPVVYSNRNFAGASRVLRSDWNVSDDWDGSPNMIRAIRVPTGWYVTIYEKRNYRGRSLLISNDAVFENNNEWFDNIGSIAVSKGRPPR